MRSKRADIFNLYFILFVFMLCGIVIVAYVHSQNVANNVVLSSEPLLKIEDELRVLEYNEQTIASDLISNNDFNVDSFCVNLTNYGDFLKENLVYKNNEIPAESWTSTSWTNFCKEIYSMSSEGETLILKRSLLRKEFDIGIPDEEREENLLNYPVEIVFEYEKEYKFDLTGNLIE